jgi:hypothetical protein
VDYFRDFASLDARLLERTEDAFDQPMLGTKNLGRPGFAVVFIDREKIGVGSANIYSDSPGHRRRC